VRSSRRVWCVSGLQVQLKQAEAYAARDALAKDIYDRIFAWLISACNKQLAGAGRGTEEEPGLLFIGILDIFGFEIFEVTWEVHLHQCGSGLGVDAV
jgi:myosin heavy subunit